MNDKDIDQCEMCNNFSHIDNTCYIYGDPNFGISKCNDFIKGDFCNDL